MALDSRANISSAAGIVYTEEAALAQGDLQTLLGAYRELSVTEIINALFLLPVQWETLHSSDVEWGGTNALPVQWETTHEGEVEWED